MDKNELDDHLDSLDRYYIERWDQESRYWAESHDIYRFVEEMLDLQDGEIHADLGSGTGALLAKLKNSGSKATLIGIERKKVILSMSASILRTSGLPTQQLFTMDQQVNHDDQIHTQFSVDENRLLQMNFFDHETINLLQDDIRSLKVLRHILRGRKIDSATFMFPGMSESMAFDPPFTIKGMDIYKKMIDEYRRMKGSDFCDQAGLEECQRKLEASKEKLNARIRKIMDETRTDVYRQLSDLIRFNGRLVVVERADPAVLMEERDNTQKVKTSVMGECGRYWDAESPEPIIGVRPRKFGSDCVITLVRDENEFIDEGGKVHELSDTDDRAVIIQKFVRNKEEFKDE